MDSFKEKYLRFIKIEKQYVDLKVNGEYVWPYFRNKIIGLLHKENFKQTSATKITENYSREDKTKTLENIEQTDILVFLFNRFYYDESLSVKDGATDVLCNFLEQKKLSYEKIIFKNETEFETPYGFYDIKDIEVRYQKLLKKKINLFKNINLDAISKDISKQLNISFDANDYVHEISAKINSYHEMIGKYYDKIKPKYVVVTSNYMRNEIISAAKKRNIKVIECQYAAITDYHTGYHYDRIEVPYYPDCILSWGDYFTEYENYPLNCEVLTIGKEKKTSKKKNENKTLIVSQNLNAKEFQKITLDLAENFKDIEYIYRKHPNESMDISFIKKIEKLSNVEVSTNSLVDDLSMSSNVIASSSTVVYDAIDAGKKVFLIDSYLSIFSEKLKRLHLVNDVGKFSNFKELENKKVHIYSEKIENIDIFKGLKSREKRIQNKELNDKLTIVISTYNSEKTIRDTLLSIYQASEDIKVILVDDCSSDNTVEVVKSLSEHMNIEIIAMDYNSGDASTPRNIALQVVDTKYIYFLDSDDLMMPNVVLEALNIMDKKSLDFIKFKAVIKDTSGSSLLHPGRKFLFKENSSLKNSPFMWNGIYKKSIINDNNISFKQGIAEDLLFNLIYFRHVKRYKYLYEVGIIYQKENSTVSTNLNAQKYMLLLDNHLRSKKIIEDNYSKEMLFFFKDEIIYKMLILDNDYYNFIRGNVKFSLEINEKLADLLECSSNTLDEDISKWIRDNYHMKFKFINKQLFLQSSLSNYTCEKLQVPKEIEIKLSNSKYKISEINNIIVDNIVFYSDNILHRVKVNSNEIEVKSYRKKIIQIIIRVIFGNFSTKIRKRMIKLLIDVK